MSLPPRSTLVRSRRKSAAIARNFWNSILRSVTVNRANKARINGLDEHIDSPRELVGALLESLEESLPSRPVLRPLEESVFIRQGDYWTHASIIRMQPANRLTKFEDIRAAQALLKSILQPRCGRVGRVLLVEVSRINLPMIRRIACTNQVITRRTVYANT